MTKRRRVIVSPRELQVVLGLAEGMTIKEIAAGLDLSAWTIRGYLANARQRTDSRTTEQLVARFASLRSSTI